MRALETARSSSVAGQHVLIDRDAGVKIDLGENEVVTRLQICLEHHIVSILLMLASNELYVTAIQSADHDLRHEWAIPILLWHHTTSHLRHSEEDFRVIGHMNP